MKTHIDLQNVTSIQVEEPIDLPSGHHIRRVHFYGTDDSCATVVAFGSPDVPDALRIEGDAPREHRVPATEAPYGVDMDALRNDEMLERFRKGKA